MTNDDKSKEAMIYVVEIGEKTELKIVNKYPIFRVESQIVILN